MDGIHLFQILKYTCPPSGFCQLCFVVNSDVEGTYRLVKSESLFVPAKFLSGVQVEAILWSTIYDDKAETKPRDKKEKHPVIEIVDGKGEEAAENEFPLQSTSTLYQGPHHCQRVPLQQNLQHFGIFLFWFCNT